jgi:hypothetical protein
MNSDLLDEYCEMEYGHTDWVMSWDKDDNMVITFHKKPSTEYLLENGTPVRMRKDLAEQELLIPAGKSYKDYDDLQEITHLSVEDLEGAVEYDTGEDPDSHAFCPVMLRDGRVFYMIGVDLDWFYEEEDV